MKLYAVISSVLLSVISNAQVRIAGVISDTSGAPAPYVTVSLLSATDSGIVKGTLSDQTGKYLLATAGAGKYLIKISGSGYADKISDPIVVDSGASNDLQIDFRLTVLQRTLADVSVVGIRKVIEFRNGNTVVNVENSPLARGNSAYDLLLKLPGVSEYENNLMIQGKTGVVVLIDDRPQRISGAALINLLKSMNADLIRTIEILKNPPVKYDASGTSGMINIKTKKVVVSGVSGTVFSSWTQGIRGRFTPGATLNYKSKNIVLFSSISGEIGDYREKQQLVSTFASDSGATTLTNDNIYLNHVRNLNYKGGLDWMPDNKNTLGFKIEGSSGHNTSRTTGPTAVSGYNDLGYDHLAANIDQHDNWQSTNFNINYEHKLDSMGSSFTVVADYTRLPEKLGSANQNVFYDEKDLAVLDSNNYRSSNNSNSYVWSGRADLTKVLNTVSTIEAGAKASFVRTTNDYLFERDYNNDGGYSVDPAVSNNFHYREKTYAAYANYIGNFKKLNLRVGARIERTSLKGGSDNGQAEISRDYFQLFPNVALSYKKSADHSFQLNLTRRTDRPNFADLNPFKLFIDQYTFQEGNPFLLPTFTNRAEFSYNFKDLISTSAAYSYTPDIMMQYIRQNDTALTTIQSIKNMQSNHNFEYSAFYQQNLTGKWNVNISGSFSYQDYKGDIAGIAFHRTGITYSGNITNLISVGKDAKIEVSGLYSGPNIYGIVRFKPKWMASLAIRKPVFSNKFDLTAGVDDIFRTFVSKVSSNDLDQNWSSVKSYDTRRFKISLTYKFGKIRIGQRNVNASNDAEKGRLNH